MYTATEPLNSNKSEARIADLLMLLLMNNGQSRFIHVTQSPLGINNDAIGMSTSCEIRSK